MSERTHTFWMDDAQGGKGGYFIRAELGPFFVKLREAGHTVVGIVVDEDSRNVEVLVAEPDALLAGVDAARATPERGPDTPEVL